MKTFVFLSVFVLLGPKCFSQINNSEKIIEAYGIDWYNQMSEVNTEILNLVDKYAEHGFIVQEVNADKGGEIKVLQTIPLRSKQGGTVTIAEFLIDFNGPNFNPLKYDFFPTKEMQTYKLEGSNYLIYILSQETILNK